MNEEKKVLIERMADRITDHPSDMWSMDIEHFDWVPGVGLFGIYNAYTKTNNEKYLDYIKGWFKRHIGEAYESKTVNSTAPLITAAYLYEITGDENIRKTLTDAANQIIKTAPRTCDGGLEHTVTEAGAVFKEQIWADTLFMVCIFLAKLGALTGDKTYSDFALSQLEIHHRLLKADDGLYYHAYSGASKDHLSGVKWARANSWIVYSTAKIIEILGDFSQKDEFSACLGAHVEALSKVQSENGGFHTVLTEESSYCETSATAAIAAGIKVGIENGFLDEKYSKVCQKAQEFVISEIAEDGTVESVSGGTPVMPDIEAYKAIEIVPTLYGQGLSIMAL